MVNIATPELYSAYKASMQKIADIRFSAALLQWDQETYMPPKSISKRAQQIATLTEIAHQLFTNEEMGNLLEELSQRGDLTADEQRNTELSLYDYNKEKKLSSEFVRSMSETISQSFESWMSGRKANSFRVFEKDLARLLALKKEQAYQLGYEGHPYNALLNEYEKGATVEQLNDIFDVIEQPLSNLIQKISDQPQVADDFLLKHFPEQQQWDYGMELVKNLGFDFKAGRQDFAEHPFPTNFSSKDVRITTRIDEHNFGNMTWSCLHELGHALYEQGLPDSEYGLPLSEYASLSIHESQSRLWENNVGRSEGFWNHNILMLKSKFTSQLEGIDARSFFKGINKVQPSLIRTEADELTYHFHVMIRYKLEKLLIAGELTARDIPAAWNELYKEHLGVVVPDDKQGCLQDVHWSHGSFGYFPTYSLGSLYAAQIFATAAKQLPFLKEDINNGKTSALLAWLRTHIHEHGRKYTSSQLCRTITGETLNVNYFLQYAVDKYQDIYNFK
ncbi:MAG: carboxypeptidase M32 [Chitinophagaceae bacterium]